MTYSDLNSASNHLRTSLRILANYQGAIEDLNHLNGYLNDYLGSKISSAAERLDPSSSSYDPTEARYVLLFIPDTSEVVDLLAKSFVNRNIAAQWVRAANEAAWFIWIASGQTSAPV